MDVIDRFRPFRLSPHTREITEYLVLIEEGHVATYEELTDLVKFECSPGGEGYHYVLSAIRRLEKRGHNFANIPKVGYRKLNPNETVKDVSDRQERLGSNVKRNLTKLAGTDYDRLGTAERLEYNAVTLFARMARRVLSCRAKQKLISEIEKDPHKELDYEAMTEIYLRKHGKVKPIPEEAA